MEEVMLAFLIYPSFSYAITPFATALPITSTFVNKIGLADQCASCRIETFLAFRGHISRVRVIVNSPSKLLGNRISLLSYNISKVLWRPSTKYTNSIKENISFLILFRLRAYGNLNCAVT
jgi:hypothetical protein